MNDVMNVIINDIYTYIIENMDRISNVKFDYDTELEMIGIDSMGFIDIIVYIEEKYECIFPDEYLIISELSTVRKIAKATYEQIQ